MYLYLSIHVITDKVQTIVFVENSMKLQILINKSLIDKGGLFVSADIS